MKPRLLLLKNPNTTMPFDDIKGVCVIANAFADAEVRPSAGFAA